ncbi:MAG: hypothetical protein GY926_19875 [bacterium]|nr:hypothetical protein [bacterium]
MVLASLLWPLSLDVGTAETAWLIGIHLLVAAIILSLLPGSVGLVTRPFNDSGYPPESQAGWPPEGQDRA